MALVEQITTIFVTFIRYGVVLNNLRQEFIKFSVETGVLRFGEFVTKAGRTSPYFFNAGLFNQGGTLATLAEFYAQTLIDSGIEFDMLFGPAYKARIGDRCGAGEQRARRIVCV